MSQWWCCFSKYLCIALDDFQHICDVGFVKRRHFRIVENTKAIAKLAVGERQRGKHFQRRRRHATLFVSTRVNEHLLKNRMMLQYKQRWFTLLADASLYSTTPASSNCKRASWVKNKLAPSTMMRNRATPFGNYTLFLFVIIIYAQRINKQYQFSNVAQINSTRTTTARLHTKQTHINIPSTMRRMRTEHV